MLSRGVPAYPGTGLSRDVPARPAVCRDICRDSCRDEILGQDVPGYAGTAGTCRDKPVPGYAGTAPVRVSKSCPGMSRDKLWVHYLLEPFFANRAVLTKTLRLACIVEGPRWGSPISCLVFCRVGPPKRKRPKEVNWRCSMARHPP